MSTTRWPEAAWHYQDETLHHELTVMHDDGNYRNLMFRNPASSLYWFSLATWPGRSTSAPSTGWTPTTSTSSSSTSCGRASPSGTVSTATSA
jgi:hypothetical protein